MDFILKVQWSGEGMDKNLINQLLALPGEELHLKKGDFLFHEGDKAEHFYVVLKGSMRRTQELMCSTPSLGRIALFIPFAMMC